MCHANTNPVGTINTIHRTIIVDDAMIRCTSFDHDFIELYTSKSETNGNTAITGEERVSYRSRFRFGQHIVSAHTDRILHFSGLHVLSFFCLLGLLGFL